MSGARDVLAAIEAAEAAKPMREPDFLPVSAAVMAPPGQAPPQPLPPLGWAEIRAVRAAAGLTQDELGVLLGVRQARVRSLENPHGSQRLTGLEDDVMQLLRICVNSWVNEGDRHQWAKGLVLLAERHRPLSAVAQMMADVAKWESAKGGPT